MPQEFRAELDVQRVRRGRSIQFEAVAFLLLLAGGSTAHAAAIYGVESTVEVASGNGPATFPNQVVDFTDGGNPVPVTSYTSPVLNASGSYTFEGSTVSGSATSWATIEDSNNLLNMHGYSTAAISGVCEHCDFATENAGLFSVDFYDAITAGGLPSGTPESLLITATLNSSISAPSGQTYAYADFSVDSKGDANATNTGGASNGLISQSIVVQTTSGANLPFVASLYGIAYVNDNYPGNDLTESESATVDASDTANFYITVLTPGASYTTASGLSYTEVAPEPASLGLAGGALLAFWAGMRTRKRRNRAAAKARNEPVSLP
jgi:hypothetical protein